MSSDPTYNFIDAFIDQLGATTEGRKLLRTAAERFGYGIFIPALRLGLTGSTALLYRQSPIVDAKSTIAFVNGAQSGDSTSNVGGNVSPAHNQSGGSKPVMAPYALGSLQTLSPEVGYYALRWRSQGTLRRYETGFRKILMWSLELGVDPFPTSPALAMELVSHEASTGKSMSSVQSLRDTISMIAKVSGDPDPTDNYHFRRVMTGIRRTLGNSNPNRKIAFTREEVGAMIAVARAELHEDHAMILATLFEGALRCDEIVHLCRRHVIIQPTSTTLFVERSKTDQNGIGMPVTLEHRDGAPFDAPQMLRAWLRRLDSASDVVFPGPSGHPRRYHREINRMVKRYAATIGIDPETVGTHSCRAGWATAEISLGRNLAEVAAHMRHASLDMVLRYYRPRGQRTNFAGRADAGYTR